MITFPTILSEKSKVNSFLNNILINLELNDKVLLNKGNLIIISKFVVLQCNMEEFFDINLIGIFDVNKIKILKELKSDQYTTEIILAKAFEKNESLKDFSFESNKDSILIEEFNGLVNLSLKPYQKIIFTNSDTIIDADTGEIISEYEFLNFENMIYGHISTAVPKLLAKITSANSYLTRYSSSIYNDKRVVEMDFIQNFGTKNKFFKFQCQFKNMKELAALGL